MPNTYKKIASVTVGSGGAASIDFTNIPQTYTDLKIVLSLREETGIDVTGYLKFNSNSNNYSSRIIQGNGSSTLSATGTTTSLNAMVVSSSGYTASVFSNAEIYIPNYTSANFKSISSDSVTENNATLSYSRLLAGLWSDTSAITSISIYPNVGDWAQHSTATLYGIGDVTASKFAKATGGVITYDANYVYHTYPYSGTFTPNTALTVDYLVVAGGGGGGGDGQNTGGGAGGAGGLRCTVGATGGGGSLETPLSLSSGSAYTVTVGSGGSAGSSRTNNGTNGSNSVFASITSIGGGKGGSSQGASGSSGGSGGGGNYTTPGSGGAGTTNQGFAGGAGQGGDNRPGGGGGGASSVGANATGTVAGNGGNGVTTSISGISTTYAGGGGGGTWNGGTRGTGGAGGGGNGGTVSGNNSGSAATVNTGGGGGGGSVQDAGQSNGGAGGSGIVIIRYPR